jgi:hypothetical protein
MVLPRINVFRPGQPFDNDYEEINERSGIDQGVLYVVRAIP